jgi:hypothetical protein
VVSVSSDAVDFICVESCAERRSGFLARQTRLPGEAALAVLRAAKELRPRRDLHFVQGGRSGRPDSFWLKQPIRHRNYYVYIMSNLSRTLYYRRSQ